jgi:hypothetical protein
LLPHISTQRERLASLHKQSQIDLWPDVDTTFSIAAKGPVPVVTSHPQRKIVISAFPPSLTKNTASSTSEDRPEGIPEELHDIKTQLHKHTSVQDKILF